MDRTAEAFPRECIDMGVHTRGILDDIISDRDMHFMSHIWGSLKAQLGMKCCHRTIVVGKRLPPLQSHAIEWVRHWVRVITALHHAVDKVE